MRGLALQIWLTLGVGVWLAAGSLGAWAGPVEAPLPAYGPGPSRPPVGQLRADLKDILARPEYQDQTEDASLAWQLRLLRAIANWWREHLTPLMSRLHTDSPVGYWIIFSLALLIALILLYHIIYTLKTALGDRGGARVRRRGVIGVEEATNPHDLLAKADAAASEGHFAEALRHLYLALIRYLDRQALVRYDQSRTNREYLAQVRKWPRVLEPLKPLTEEVDRVWYGGRVATAEQYAVCRGWALEAWQAGGDDATP